MEVKSHGIFHGCGCAQLLDGIVEKLCSIQASSRKVDGALLSFHESGTMVSFFPSNAKWIRWGSQFEIALEGGKTLSAVGIIVSDVVAVEYSPSHSSCGRHHSLGYGCSKAQPQPQ